MKKLPLVILFAGLMIPAWAEDSKPTPEPSPLEKAVQKFKEVEAKNAEEMGAEIQELQQSAKVVGAKVTEALTPLAKKLKMKAETEAPALIEAAAEQSRANGKLVSGLLRAFKNLANEVVEEVAK